MSIIKALTTADTGASPYLGTQAGYDAMIAALAGGGCFEMTTGLESITEGTPASGIVGLRWRSSPIPGMELIGICDLILANGQSIRFHDTGGTMRTVLTALGSGVLRLAYLGSSGLTITDQNGNIKCTVTGSRIAPASGVDFAPNSLPGTTGQVLTSAGAAASPTWTTPAGLPGSAMVQQLTAPFWVNGLNTTNGYVYSSLAAAGASNNCVWNVPSNYTATSSWQLYWTQPGNDTANLCSFQFSMYKFGAAGFDFSTATFTSSAQQNVAGSGTSLLAITTMPTPAVSFSAGDKVALKITRISNTSTFLVHFIGMQHNYT